MAAQADQLEEIVVSAMRRDTTTADIPYSISAISAKSLEDNHVTSLADLTKQIAGVSFIDEGIPVSAAPNDILGPLLFTPKNNANDSNQSHARVALLLKPDAHFSALLSYYHQNDTAFGIQAISPHFGGTVDTPSAQNPFYSASYPVSFPTGGTVFPQNSPYDTNDSFLLNTKRHTDLVSADLSYNFGFASLSSDTSYYKDGGTDVQDNTGLLTLYPSFYGFLPRMVDYQTGGLSRSVSQ